MAKAKTQKKATTAKSPAKKKATAKAGAKAKAPIKAKKPAPKAKVVKGKAAPALKKKPTTPTAKKVVAKAAPTKAAKASAPKPKAVVPAAKAAPQKPAVKAFAPKVNKPVAQPAAPAAAAPKPTVATKAPAPAPAPAKAAEKAVIPAKVEKTPSAKEAKPKQPIIAVMAGVEPIGGPAKTLKRAMKERFSMEFYLNATPSSLYDMLSTPSGLSEWFCEDVDVRGDQFTFRWGGDTQTAQCLSRKFGELMRFQWEDDEDRGAYFELRIRIDPMTNETCLVVTDHAWPKDMEEARALWGSQIHTLQRVLGA